jgi:hypothetical protein
MRIRTFDERPARLAVETKYPGVRASAENRYAAGATNVDER